MINSSSLEFCSKLINVSMYGAPCVNLLFEIQLFYAFSHYLLNNQKNAHCSIYAAGRGIDSSRSSASSSAGFLTIQEAGGQTLEQTLTSAISRAIRETFNSRSSIQVRLFILWIFHRFSIYIMNIYVL